MNESCINQISKEIELESTVSIRHSLIQPLLHKCNDHNDKESCKELEKTHILLDEARMLSFSKRKRLLDACYIKNLQY